MNNKCEYINKCGIAEMPDLKCNDNYKNCFIYQRFKALETGCCEDSHLSEILNEEIRK